MKTDTEVRIQGLRALVDALGPMEAERFITLVLREPFDYTIWQKDLWASQSVEEISQAAMERRSAQPDESMEPTAEKRAAHPQRWAGTHSQGSSQDHNLAMISYEKAVGP